MTHYKDPDSPLALAKITPTMELILEVLIARTRLGHHFWTFDRNPSSTRAVFRLADRGFVVHMHGNVENTFRAYLTEEARAWLFLPDYVPPIQGGPH